LDAEKSLVGVKFQAKQRRTTQPSESEKPAPEKQVPEKPATEKPAETNMEPSSPMKTTPASPTLTDRNGRVSVLFKAPDAPSQSSYEQLQQRLQDVSDEEATQFAKSLLKDFGKEGTLLKLMLVLVRQDPKKFISSACDISDFRLAKFGGFSKMQKIIEDFDQ